MGISQGSRLVSTNAASGPLLLGPGLPGARSGMPCARGPPCVTSPEAAALPGWPAAARGARNPLEDDLLAHGHKRREAMRQHRLSRTPDSLKLARDTASNVTRRSSRCLPPVPLIRLVRTTGTGVGGPWRLPATRRA